jgi:hypothetical protein
MNKKRRNNRYTRAAKAMNPYANLAADIIIDALLIASGQGDGSAEERAEASSWIRGEQCYRWAGVIGIDLDVALRHKDCVLRIEYEK